jgi:3-mercaptopyruvate sulfurtransferase SseA
MKFVYLAIFVAITATTSFAQEQKNYKDDKEVPRMTVQEAKKEFDAENAVIVDARSAASFAEEHIEKALNIPNGSSASEYSKLPKGKKIIVYCS